MKKEILNIEMLKTKKIKQKLKELAKKKHIINLSMIKKTFQNKRNIRINQIINRKKTIIKNLIYLMQKKEKISKRVIKKLKKKNNKWKGEYLSLYKINWTHCYHYLQLYVKTYDNQNSTKINIIRQYIKYRPMGIKIMIKRIKKFLNKYKDEISREQTHNEYIAILKEPNNMLLKSNRKRFYYGYPLTSFCDGPETPLDNLEFLGKYAKVFLLYERYIYSSLSKISLYNYNTYEHIYEYSCMNMEYILRCLFIFECDELPKTEENKKEFFENILNVLVQKKNYFLDKIAKQFPIIIEEQCITISEIAYNDLFIALLYRHLRYLLTDKEYEEQFFECYHKLLPPGPNTEILYQKPKIFENYLITDEVMTNTIFKESHLEYLESVLGKKHFIQEIFAIMGSQYVSREKDKDYYSIVAAYLINIHMSPYFRIICAINYKNILIAKEYAGKQVNDYFKKNQYIKKIRNERI